MQIGVPVESRLGEARVAATPETVKKLVAAKHSVLIEAGAGSSASYTDEAYTAAGASIGSAVDGRPPDPASRRRRAWRDAVTGSPCGAGSA